MDQANSPSPRNTDRGLQSDRAAWARAYLASAPVLTLAQYAVLRDNLLTIIDSTIRGGRSESETRQAMQEIMALRASVLPATLRATRDFTSEIDDSEDSMQKS